MAKPMPLVFSSNFPTDLIRLPARLADDIRLDLELRFAGQALDHSLLGGLPENRRNNRHRKENRHARYGADNRSFGVRRNWREHPVGERPRR